MTNNDALCRLHRTAHSRDSTQARRGRAITPPPVGGETLESWLLANTSLPVSGLQPRWWHHVSSDRKATGRRRSS